MSSIGTSTSRSSCLRTPASTTATSRGRPGVVEPAEEPRDLVQRPLRRRQTDPLEGPLGLGGEALERQHQVGAALGRGHDVDLVDDHRRDAAERLARLRGQHQVERFRRRDQDVGRRPQQTATFAGVRVPGPDADRRHVGERRSRDARPPPGCPPGVRAGSSRCRPRARAAARCTGRGSALRARGAARRPSGRSPTGTPRGSCPSRWARGAACCGPSAIGGQPWRWASVGSPNDDANQDRAAGEKAVSVTAPPRYLVSPTRAAPPGRRTSGSVSSLTRSAAIGHCPAMRPPRFLSMVLSILVVGAMLSAVGTASATERRGHGYRSWLRGDPADVHPGTDRRRHARRGRLRPRHRLAVVPRARRATATS